VELPATPEQLLQRPSAHDSNSTTPKTGSTPQASSSADEATLVSTQQPQQQAVGVAVTKGMLVRLLQQCPDAAVREQLYCEVLQPKLQQATRLLGQLARYACCADHITHSCCLSLSFNCCVNCNKQAVQL
jgi:hypothetical protein